ncbi:hypothetical protein IP91_01417 [Pseudoduganella lurida]|uniref:Uncharacterized protein n=1 Tax=Pseudoduganella lurida TaxID=1036180 RepID=A0A562RFE1_9BURK|nr:hypothetical protein [Pseudoduganella lurida]TWI67304.1 hypothetical protein IP91_01417 [Pseudoduganella lurida]
MEQDGGGAGGERRTDAALAALIDQGIGFDADCGATIAWAFLARHGVPPALILRVLAAPGEGSAPRRTRGATAPPAPLQ